jgi:single-strand DNA-binding protein
MLNNVVLVGRITRDPELRTTASGQSTVSFSVAVERNFKDQNGETQADFINCVAWRNQAEFISRYIKKGFLISVQGRLQTRSYLDQNQQTRFVTEVVVENVSNLQPRDPNSNSNQELGQQNYQQNYQRPQQNNNDVDQQFEASEVSEDDLPF